MRATHGDAAKIRDRLAYHVPAPAAFRAALVDVPPLERDRWVDILWDVHELPDDEPLPRGCVPYLPCPVDTVLDAVQHAAVTRDDVFVDVGSGLGRAAFLAHLLTGAACIGIEIQPTLVAAARGRAAWLHLSRTRFIAGDAVDLVRFITIGTVFFLYCPFSGERLRRVLDDLEALARTRPIRICCVDLPTLDCGWLAPIAPPVGGLTVYRSIN
jgi:SAM-dependent methyltransferase